MRKGIFWCKDHNTDSPELIVVSALCDRNGNAAVGTIFSSKSGGNFNHKAEWERLGKSVTGEHPYNYFPRGRVEIRNGKVSIFLNPDLHKEPVLGMVFEVFGLKTDEQLLVRVISDGSQHYQYG